MSLRRLHVLHVAQPTTEGVATVTTGYVRDQVERGWNVTVACPSDGSLGYDARAAGARVRWWEASREPGLSVLAECARLRRVLDAVNPDVVHLHSSKAGLVGRLVVRDTVPTVFQPHAWSFLAAGGVTRRLAWRWERRATRWTTELICVSEAERAIGEAVGIRSPGSVLPNGVDLAAFPAQGDRERVQARRVLGLRPGPTVVCVGRLARQKGQTDLLRVWPAVRAAVPHAQLVLVGDGPDRDMLVGQARGLAGVSMVGARVDIPLWYAAADVVVVPSRWEGMALVPLEAMASSRSVVGYDVAGMSESIPPQAGAVVPGDDLRSLCDALVRRLIDPGLVEDEGWNGRTHAEVNHDATRPARDLARIYLRLASRRGR